MKKDKILNWNLLKDEKLSDTALRGIYVSDKVGAINVYLDLDDDVQNYENFKALLSSKGGTFDLLTPDKLNAVKQTITKGILEDAYHQSDENHTEEEYETLLNELEFIEIGIHREACVNLFFNTSHGMIVAHADEDLTIDEFYFC